MTLSHKLALSLSSGLGSGFFPWASGTSGSLAYLLIYYFFYLLGLDTFLAQVIILILLTILGTISSQICLKHNLGENFTRKKLLAHKKNDHDPSYIVVDEWAGMQVALLAASFSCPASIILAFVLFRFFDVLKPPPAKQLERLPGAYGVMADDLAAGAMAAIVLYIVGKYLNLCGLF